MNFEIEKQISVPIANQPGQVAKISSLIAEHHLHLRAVTISEQGDQGSFRFIACQAEKAIRLLRASGYDPKTDEVLSIRLQDSRGKLAELASALAQAGVNIDYVYASVDDEGANSRLVLKVSNIRLAQMLLHELTEAA